MRSARVVGNQKGPGIVNACNPAMQWRPVLFAVRHAGIQACCMVKPWFAYSGESLSEPDIQKLLEFRGQSGQPGITVHLCAQGIQVGDAHSVYHGVAREVDSDAHNDRIEPASGAGRLDEDAANLVARNQNIVGPFASYLTQIRRNTGKRERDRKACHQGNLGRIGMGTVGPQKERCVRISGR